jgi:hypothetical protein
LIRLGVCSECSLCTLSRTTPSCSLCTLSRTTPSCSLCTLSRTTPSCSLCTLSSTTGSLRGGSFTLPLWMRVGWGPSIGPVSLRESLLQGEVSGSRGLLHLVTYPSRLMRNPQLWHMRLPLCHLRQAFLGFNHCIWIISSKSG